MNDTDHDFWNTAREKAQAKNDVDLAAKITSHIRTSLGYPSASSTSGPQPQLQPPISGIGLIGTPTSFPLSQPPLVNPQIVGVGVQPQIFGPNGMFTPTASVADSSKDADERDLRERCVEKALRVQSTNVNYDITESIIMRADAMFRYIKTGKTDPS